MDKIKIGSIPIVLMQKLRGLKIKLKNTLKRKATMLS
jgi:hypothetical protein